MQKEERYYNEIAYIIETVEVNARVRKLQDNSEKLKAYWKTYCGSTKW